MDDGRPPDPNPIDDASQRRRELDRVVMVPRRRWIGQRLTEASSKAWSGSRQLAGTLRRAVFLGLGNMAGTFRRGLRKVTGTFLRLLRSVAGILCGILRSTLRRTLERRPRLLPVAATILATLCLSLACTLPGSRPDVRPARPETPVDRPTPADSEGVELAGVVSHAVVRPIDDRDDAKQATVPEPVLGPLVLRVGLATDLERVDLPCCGSEVLLHFGDRTLTLDRRTTVVPAAGIGQTAIYRLQVAALKDEGQADGIADYLNAETDYPAESVFDADTDLYRVRVGRFATRTAAETAQGGLAGLGVIQSWVVSEGGELENAAFVVHRSGGGEQDEEEVVYEGRWLDLYSGETRAGEALGQEASTHGIPFDRHRYRGRILLFLNDRGLINVINELPLEEYLRGVVPKEMGPELYNELEALKAQTVAARTYTLRNLGEFAGEGYDICSTPRCQVYGGMGVEHPTTDLAIRQTHGQVVLYEGRPAETFYSATCGGHTEDVEVIFPLKTGAYLRGVPCLEAGTTTLQGDAVALHDMPQGLVDLLLPTAPGDPPTQLSARLEYLALLADLPVPTDRLHSLERTEVLRYVSSLYDVALDRRLVQSARKVRAWLEEPPDHWGERERRFGRYLINSALLETPLRDTIGDGDATTSTVSSMSSMSHGETTRLLFELSLYFGVLEEESVYFLEFKDAALHVRNNGARPAYDLGTGFSTFRRRGERLVPGKLELMAGDPLVIYRSRGRIVSLAQPVDAPEVDLGRRAPRQSWTLWKSDEELRRAVQTRYPGFPFRDFEVLERGVSGRVGRLALLGDEGRRVEVEGLAVRWTLDVPDTWFHAERIDREGAHGWVFRGRGWGHGVGMSQAGAFGMAVRGSSYREILEHYYTGIRLGRLKPVPPRPRLPVG